MNYINSPFFFESLDFPNETMVFPWFHRPNVLDAYATNLEVGSIQIFVLH